MTEGFINPESKIAQQYEGMWHTYCFLLLKKLSPEGVTLTHQDIQELLINTDDKFILIHGNKDSIEFKLVAQEEAEQLEKLDAAKTGVKN